jgi:hypothetical protein
MESLVAIWKPTGKEPSGLWQAEANSFNDVFMDLARYFEEHQTYGYSFRSWDPAESIVHSHSSMTISRIAKWLAYYGLVEHRTESKKTGNDEKATLFHILSPTLKIRLSLEKGELLKIGKSYSEGQTIGIGKPYPSYIETEKWLTQTYEQNKVALWRRAKWWSDFHRLYNENLAKTREEMQKIMANWLRPLIASIPIRGRKGRVQAQMEMDLNPLIRKQVSLEGWQNDA